MSIGAPQTPLIPAPGVSLVPLVYDLCHTFRLHISRHWLRSPCKPRKLYTTLSPGVYHLSFSLGHPNGLRSEVWAGILDLQVVTPDERSKLGELINFAAFEKYTPTHFTTGLISLSQAVKLEENNVAHLYAGLTPTVSEVHDVPAASMAQFSPGELPVIVLLDDAHVAIAHTVTPATHGRKSGHFRARGIKQILQESKQAPGFLPTPAQLQNNPDAKHAKNAQLFRGAASAIPSEIPNAELQAAAALASASPLLASPVEAPRRSPSPGLGCDACKGGSAASASAPFRSVMVTADMSMKIKSMERETVMAWGTTILVLLSAAIIARLLLF